MVGSRGLGRSECRLDTGSKIEKDSIESDVKKAKSYSYLTSDFEHVHTLVESMESKLYNTVLSNPHHVLYQLLPPEKDIGYNLRQ